MSLPPSRPPQPSGMPGPRPMYQAQQSQQQAFVGIETPHSHDVLSGRGVTTNRHPGNEKFRSLVNCNKELYVTSTKRQKMTISRGIVDAVRSLDPPGRFLEKDLSTGMWVDIGDKKAIEKTSQALRDGAACLRKQLSQDLGDPDFLSAVFDADALPPQALAAAAKSSAKGKSTKGKPPAKGHRRTKSNPCLGSELKTKSLTKKARSTEVPMSPKRNTLSLHMIPRPPQSPMSPGSDRSSPGLGRPAPPYHVTQHTRTRSLSAVPVLSGSEFSSNMIPPVSPHSRAYEGYHPLRTQSYDYQSERPRHDHGVRGPYGSPSYSGGPPPPSPTHSQHMHHHHHQMSPHGSANHHMSPGAPMSPLPPGSHRMSPSGYQQTPVSSPGVPWSPRSSHSHHPTLSPHPYLHPSDMTGNRSPDYRPHLSPRCQQGGYNNSGLSVPALGGERSSPHSAPISPIWRQANAYQPQHPMRNSHSHVPLHPGQRVPRDFAPPSSMSLRRPDGSYPDHSYSGSSRVMSPAMHPKVLDARRKAENDLHVTPSPTNEKPGDQMISPSAVADVARSDGISNGRRLSPIRSKSSRDYDEHPFDEDNPADDRISVSPLPYDHEDSLSLMELPDNILTLPISPCGPDDYM